jgi:predicted RNA binding protein YcfA (HicA-like mRNA interferase family)
MVLVTHSELKRMLRAAGCSFEEGKKHTIVRLGSRFSVMPRHATKEVPVGTLRAILKALGLKAKE